MTGMSHTPPSRVLAFEGSTNFRDLGGYPGEDGRTVRWRRLFRSEHLAGLSPADHQGLAALGVKRSFDFRGVQERAATPYAIDGVVQHSLSIEPTVTQRMQALVAAGHAMNAALAMELMRELYRSLINDRAARFAEFFQHLLDDDSPAVFHCTAGKDRTGVAAALFLLALGVPRELVRQDFLLTNQLYRHPPLPPSDTPAEVLAVLWRVEDSYLQTALDILDRDHGGPLAYLERRLGLGPAALAALKARYLEPA